MLCTFGFEQWLQSKDTFFILNTSFVNIVSGIVVLYALAVKIKKDKNIFKNYPLEAFLIILLYFYASASVLWSPVPEISSDNLFHVITYIILIVLISPLLIQNKNDAYDAMVFLIIFGGSISLLLLLFTEWNYRSIVLASVSMKAKANPLALANLAGYVMLAAVLLNLRNKYKIWKVIRLALIVISLAVAVKTGSRGQFLLMLLVSLLFLPVSQPFNQIKKFVPLIITVAFTLVVAYWAMSEFIGGDARWESGKMSDDISGRYEAASKLLASWYSSPGNLIFGLGSSASYDPDIFGFYTHIVPLEIIGELGIIGFTIYLSILYLTYKNFKISLQKTGKDEIGKGVLATLAGLVVFVFLLSFKQGSFLGNQELFGLLVVLAICNKSVRKDNSTIDDVKKNVNVSGENIIPKRKLSVRLR